MLTPIQNRYEFVVLFDVENGNPNGDRMQATCRALIRNRTWHCNDVCLKRKIRNYVETVKGDAPGYKIYIKDNVPLNTSDKTAYTYLGIDEKTLKTSERKIRI